MDKETRDEITNIHCVIQDMRNRIDDCVGLLTSFDNLLNDVDVRIMRIDFKERVKELKEEVK